MQLRSAKFWNAETFIRGCFLRSWKSPETFGNKDKNIVGMCNFQVWPYTFITVMQVVGTVISQELYVLCVKSSFYFHWRYISLSISVTKPAYRNFRKVIKCDHGPFQFAARVMFHSQWFSLLNQNKVSCRVEAVANFFVCLHILPVSNICFK